MRTFTIYPSSQSSEVSARSEKPGSKDSVCFSTYQSGRPISQLLQALECLEQWLGRCSDSFKPKPQDTGVLKSLTRPRERWPRLSADPEEEASLREVPTDAGIVRVPVRGFSAVLSCSPVFSTALWVCGRLQFSCSINSCNLTLEYKLNPD